MDALLLILHMARKWRSSRRPVRSQSLFSVDVAHLYSEFCRFLTGTAQRNPHARPQPYIQSVHWPPIRVQSPRRHPRTSPPHTGYSDSDMGKKAANVGAELVRYMFSNKNSRAPQKSERKHEEGGAEIHRSPSGFDVEFAIQYVRYIWEEARPHKISRYVALSHNDRYSVGGKS